jgi:uncharacterized delta-60 repeat protein
LAKAIMEVLEPRILLSTDIVTNLNDSGSGSLRQTIASAASGDTIDFASTLSGHAITLTSGALSISQNLTIDGLGASSLAVSGDNTSTVFAITSNATVTISSLKIANGETAHNGAGIDNLGTLILNECTISGNLAVASGGGIYNGSHANLTIENSTISNNQVSELSGAGIDNDNGTLSITDSTISGNSSPNGGGAAIYNSGTATINYSTLTGNQARGEGAGIFSNDGNFTILDSTISTNTASTAGGIFSYGGPLTISGSTISGNSGGGIWAANLTLINSTISGNSASSGAGIYAYATETIVDSTIVGNSATGSGAGIKVVHGTTNLNGTIVAGNKIGSTENDLAGASTSFAGVYNLIGDTSGAGFGLSSSTNMLDQSPLLGSLGNYGGPTQTIPLLPNSEGIGYVQASSWVPISDQRGFARPQNGVSDIGAFQTQGSNSLVVNTAQDDPVGPNQLSLRDAINLADAEGGSQTITFASSLSGSTIDLTSGALTLDDTSGTLTIEGLGAAQSTVNAGGKSQVFDVSRGSAAAINGLTITGGNGSSDYGYGGGINAAGNLTITNCTVSGNTDGGIYDSGTTLNITGSTISGNSGGNGAGIYVNGGSTHILTISDSTISGNTGGWGGGISNYGTATVTDCTISGNISNADGGGIYSQGELTVIDSTLSGNTAGEGGGIDSPGGYYITVIDSTLSGNSATDDGGGIAGGGTLDGTIVAGNTGGAGPDLNGTFSGSYNLVGNAIHSVGLSSSSPYYNQLGTTSSPINPLLAPLGNYGGPTQTMALLPGSTAIGYVPAGSAATTLDQRGFARLAQSNAASDIGAFQTQTDPLFVNTNQDDPIGTGQLSLRDAINLANAEGGDQTITFAPSVDGQMIALNGNALVINDDLATLAIQGPGAGLLTINGENDTNVFTVNQGCGALIENLTITGGGTSTSSGFSGGVYNYFGNTTISGCVIANNPAGGVSNIGGRIGNLFISNSTISGNTTSGNGGGIANYASLGITDSTISGNFAVSGAGIYNGFSTSVTNCTIAGNVASDVGGGIANYYDGPRTTFTITDSTISNNTAESGGGIESTSSTVDLEGTIVADDNGGDLLGSFIGTYNLIGDGSGGLSESDRNILPTGSETTISPLLAPLGNYGGPTETMALLPGSPALDAGSTFDGITTDQRGINRPEGGAPDIGAFESQGFIVTATSGSGQSAPTNSPFSDLFVSVTANDTGLTAADLAGGIITFTDPTSGASAVLGTAAPLSALGDTSVTATANGSAGSYTVIASAAPSVGTSATFSLTNTFAPPEITISGAGSVVEGSPYTLGLSAQFPPADGGNDSIQSWTVNWGDGTAQNPDIQTVYGSPASIAHSYPLMGDYSITASATDDAGTYAASSGISLSVTTNGGTSLQISGPATGNVGSVVELQASGGNVSGEAASTLSYIWSITNSGQTVATGNGPNFDFTPSSAGSFIATVTALGDAAGPTITSYVVTVPLPQSATIAITGPQVLQVGQLAVFNFNLQDLISFYGQSQYSAWQQDYENEIINNPPPGPVGPLVQWSVYDETVGEDVTPPNSSNYLIGGTQPTTLLFEASSTHTYTVTLAISYGGSIGLQNSVTLTAAMPYMPDVVTGTLPPNFYLGYETDPLPVLGDDAFQQPDGMILTVSEGETSSGSPIWTITRWNPNLTVDTTFGDQGTGSVTVDIPSGLIGGWGPGDDWVGVSLDELFGKGVIIVPEANGDFLVGGSYLNYSFINAPSLSTAKIEYNLPLSDQTGDDDGPQISELPSVWIVGQFFENGTLDTTSFGSGGFAIDSNPNLDVLQSITIQPNGQILLGGEGYTPDESGQPLWSATAMENADARYIGDYVPLDRPAFAIARLNADGTPDTNFGPSGGDGNEFIPIASDANLASSADGEIYPYWWGTESVESMVSESDGDILVGGFTTVTHMALEDPTYWYDESDPGFDQAQMGGFALIQLSSSGELDTSFGPSGDGGKVITYFSSLDSSGSYYDNAMLTDLAVDSSGDIYAMGSVGIQGGLDVTLDPVYFSGPPTLQDAFAVAKYLPNGTLDTSFGQNGPNSVGGGGLVVSNFYGDEWAYSGTLAASGDIVMAGQAPSGGLIAEFTSDGAVNTLFGTAGFEIVSIPNTTLDMFRKVLVLQNNDIFVLGSGSVIPNDTWDDFTDNENDVVVAIYTPQNLQVSNLFATATPSGPVDLTWQNLGDGQDGFEILRSTSPTGLSPSSSVIASVGPDQTTFTDETVLPNTTYYYQVIAFGTDSAGNLNIGSPDGYSDIAGATTAPIDTGYVLEEIVPVDVNGAVTTSTMQLQEGVTYELIASGYMDLGGPDSAYRADAEYGYLFPNSTPIPNDSNVAYGIGIDDTADTLSRYPYWGPPSTTADHEYAIMYTPTTTGPIELNFHDDYYPDNSQLQYSLQVAIYRALPSSPGNLIATPDHDDDETDLSWTNTGSSSDATNATSILVERAMVTGNLTSPYSVIATLPGDSTSYADTSASYNQAYAYQLVAQNTFGQSGPSDTAYTVIVNLPPQIAAIPAQVAYTGTPFQYLVNAADPQDGENGLTYSIDGSTAPSDLAINSTTGVITWASPSLVSDSSNTYNVTISVTDKEESRSSTTMSLAVGPSLDTIPYAQTPASGVPQTGSTNTIALSVTGMDQNGGSDITYTWETVSQPSNGGLPTFSVNGTNAASTTVATVYAAGWYAFKVIMSNGNGWPGTSQTSAITVAQVLTQISVAPIDSDAIAGSTTSIQFAAQAFDQFNDLMNPQPSFTWSVAGGSAGGTINSSTGAYTPPASVPSGTTPDDIIEASATVDGVTQTGNASIAVPSAPLSPIVISSVSAAAINSNTLQLTASAQDPNDQNGQLIYIWTVENNGNPLPTFSSTNGTSAGNTVYATWATPPGTFDYTFDLTVEDPLGLVQTTSVPVDISSSDLPAPPENLVATPQGNASINLTWSTVLSGNTPSYAIFRSTSPTIPSTPLTTVTASQNSSQSYTDSSGLDSGVTYYYWVEAINDAGYSPASNDVSGQLSDATPTLTVPSPMTVTGTSAALSVTGTDPTGQNEPISYNWTITSAPQGANVQLNGAAPSATNSITTITNLMQATFSQAGTYIFQITAIDASGLSDPQDVTVTVQQVLTSIGVDPTTPTIVDGQTQTFSATGLDQFNNPMSLGAGVTWSVQSGGIGGTIIADPSIAGQATYTAPASAVGADTIVLSVAGISGSATVNVVSETAVTAVPMSTNLITLSWAGTSDAAYYQVFSDTSSNFTPSDENQVADGLTTPSFEDDSVTAGNTYYYQVYSVDASGISTLVGESAVATPSASAPAAPPGTPYNVQAAGVNDLELFVSWTQPSLTNVTSYNIEISTDQVNWNLAAIAEPTAVNWIIRTTNIYDYDVPLLGSEPYYVRVQAVGNGNTSAWSTPSNAAMTVPPTFNNVVVVVGGNIQSLPYLLQGLQVVNGRLVGTGNQEGNSVGYIWYQLIEQGYNAFISADPWDGGDGNLGRTTSTETVPAPPSVEPVLENNGQGLLLDEINQEIYNFDNNYSNLTVFQGGIVQVGLVGYSHGGGMIENISNDLFNGQYMTSMNVPVAATIDSIEYGTGPNLPPSFGYYDHSPLSNNPTQQWIGTDINYWEPNGYTNPTPWFVNGGAIHGINLSGAINNPHIPFLNYANLNHSSIGVYLPILNDAVNEITTRLYK